MIRNYLKIALRNLWRNKVYSFITIFGLTLSMSVAILIGLWVWDELNYNCFAQLGQPDGRLLPAFDLSQVIRPHLPKPEFWGGWPVNGS